MAMNLTQDEQQAVEEYKRDPVAQLENQPFMREQGTIFGRKLSGLVNEILSPDVLRSNSGRVQAAEMIAERLREQREKLERLGSNEINCDAFDEAARAELAWLGV